MRGEPQSRKVPRQRQQPRLLSFKRGSLCNQKPLQPAPFGAGCSGLPLAQKSVDNREERADKTEHEREVLLIGVPAFFSLM